MTTRFKTAIGLFLASAVANASSLDYFGPPSPDDPSAWTGPIVSDKLADDLSLMDPVYKGSLEGGPTGTAEDQGITGSIAEDELQSNGKYNVPTNSKPSPLFDATAFSQKMLRFEEFGTERLDPAGPQPQIAFPKPRIGPAPGFARCVPGRIRPDTVPTGIFQHLGEQSLAGGDRAIPWTRPRQSSCRRSSSGTGLGSSALE